MRLQKQLEIFFHGSPEVETAQKSQLIPVLLLFEGKMKTSNFKSIDFGYPTWNSLKVECYKKE